MSKAPKKPAAATKPPVIAKEGDQVIGPGVVRRQKRSPEEAAREAEKDLSYTPSEQVFRRSPSAAQNARKPQ